MIQKLFILFLLCERFVCGLCRRESEASRSPTRDGRFFRETNESCVAFDLASMEAECSQTLESDISVIIRLFDKADKYANHLSVTISQADRRYLVEYFEKLRGFYSTRNEGLNLIVELSLLIWEQEFLPFCHDVVMQVDEWRKEHFRMQHIIQWAQVRYQKFHDCLQDLQSDNCNDSIAMPMVLAAIHDEQTIEATRLSVADFREKHSELQTEYHKSRPSSSLLNLMVLWTRSFKLSDYTFDEEIRDQLGNNFEELKFRIQVALRQLADVKKDFDTMEEMVENVNGGTRNVDELFVHTPAMAARIKQLQQINTFLESSLGELRTLSQLIRNSLPDQFGAKTRKLVAEHAVFMSFSHQQRWISSGSFFVLLGQQRQVSNLTDDLNTALSFIENNPNKDSVPMVIRKALYNFYLEFNGQMQTFLRCIEDGFLAGHSLTILYMNRYLRDKNPNISYDVISRYGGSSHLHPISTILNRQTSELALFENYMTQIDQNPNDPFISRTVLTDNALTEFKDLLTKTSENLDSIFVTQCKISTSVFSVELIKQLDLETNFAYREYFDSDEITQDIYVDSYFPSIVDQLIRAQELLDYKWQDVSDCFEQNVDRFNDAVTYIRSDDGASELTLESVFVEEEESDYVPKITTTHMVAHYSIIPMHLAPIAVEIFSLHLPECPAINYDDIGTAATRNADESYSVIEVDYPSTLYRVADRSTVADYSSQLDDLSVYGHRQGGYLIEWEACRIYCMYGIDFNDIVDSVVAFGVGDFHIDRRNYTGRLRGIYINTNGPVTEDRLFVVIAFSVMSQTMNVFYVDKTGEHSYEQSGIDYYDIKDYKPSILFSGSLNFNWKRLESTIADYPTAIIDTPLYNVYEPKQIGSTENYMYVMKGLGPEFTELSEKEWFKILMSEAACTSIGVAVAYEGLYWSNVFYGILFDGNHIVLNPYINCLHDTNLPSDGDSLTSDTSSTSAEEYLYMGYTFQPIVDSKHYKLSMQLFKTGMEYVYEVVSIEEDRFVPSYSRNYAGSTESEIDSHIVPLDSPPVLPNETRVACRIQTDCVQEDGIQSSQTSEDFSCTFRKACSASGETCNEANDCAADDECISMEDWEFGVCQ